VLRRNKTFPKDSHFKFPLSRFFTSSAILDILVLILLWHAICTKREIEQIILT
jgi:hypothetical protein